MMGGRMRLIDADELKKHKYHDKKACENAVAVYYIDNAPTIKTKPIKYFDEDDKLWKVGEVIIDENTYIRPNSGDNSADNSVLLPMCDSERGRRESGENGAGT